MKGKEMKTKRHGWVFRDKKSGMYAMNKGYFISTLDYGLLKTAGAVGSRAEARDDKESNETVVKVALTKNGRPYKVIGRG